MTIGGAVIAALLIFGAIYAYYRGDELGRQQAEEWRRREDEC